MASLAIVVVTFNYIRKQKSSESLAIETGETIDAAEVLADFKYKHLFFTFPQREKFAELMKNKASV